MECRSCSFSKAALHTTQLLTSLMYWRKRLITTSDFEFMSCKIVQFSVGACEVASLQHSPGCCRYTDADVGRGYRKFNLRRLKPAVALICYKSHGNYNATRLFFGESKFHIDLRNSSLFLYSIFIFKECATSRKSFVSCIIFACTRAHKVSLTSPLISWSLFLIHFMRWFFFWCLI